MAPMRSTAWRAIASSSFVGTTITVVVAQSGEITCGSRMRPAFCSGSTAMPSDSRSSSARARTMWSFSPTPAVNTTTSTLPSTA